MPPKASTARRPKEDVNQAIGARLRRRRIDLGISQAELGNRLGLSFQQIQKYERGAANISSALLLDMSAILACPPSMLLGVSDTLPRGQEWVLSITADPEASDLVRRFAQIKSARVRKRVLTILNALLTEDGVEKDLGPRLRAAKSPQKAAVRPLKKRRAKASSS